MVPFRILAIFFVLFFSQTGLSWANSGIHFDKNNLYINGRWRALDQSGSRNGPALILPQPNLTPNFSESAREFLWKNAPALGVQNKSDVQLQRITQNNNLTSVHFTRQQKMELDGKAEIIEVKGGNTIVHYLKGQPFFTSGVSVNLNPHAFHPTISAEDAARIAYSSYGPGAGAVDKPQWKFLLQKNQTGNHNINYTGQLVYEVRVHDQNELENYTHYIDANTGELVYAKSNFQTLRKRLVMSGDGSIIDRDTFVAMVKQNQAATDVSQLVFPEAAFPINLSEIGCDPTVPFNPPAERPIASPLSQPNPCNQGFARDVQDSASSAWRNSGLVYEFYHSKFNRDSYDDQGGTMRSIVHFMQNFANAAWVDDLEVMIYGDGDPSLTYSFAKVLDIGAHEMTHGVTARTAKLEYVSESGALNESYSDVFGKLISIEYEGFRNWKLGQGLFLDPLRFVRDMENPEIPHMDNFRFRNEQCTRRNDSCGVHQNSGIPSRAAVLIAKTIGNDALAKIYYQTLTQFLQPASDFADARVQTLVSCEVLFGQGSDKCATVEKAFTAVGIR